MSKLPEWVQKLLKPQVYPEVTGSVELMQTQMSFIFLTDDYVYKVKKSVDLGYLDYTTLEKRQYFCRHEVTLNQRLCPSTYLGVVPITQDSGGIRVGGSGEVFEYAVKMRRLPQEAMMNVLLAQNRVSPEMIARVAAKMAAFHQQAETNDTISTFGGLDTIIQNTEENFSQTAKYREKTISEQQYRRIADYTRNFIAKNSSLFQKRVKDGRIRDCHGDLHAAHVCFTDDICIYDCIEFNDRFRYCDAASEIAFLAMDLDRHERTDLSQAFVKAYLEASRDSELYALLTFYKCYRAYVRGKVESFKFDDPYISETERKQTRKTASSYFSLAESYIEKSD